MTLSEKNIIKEYLVKIIGANEIRIGRAVDLIWVAMKGTDGKDYALHMQAFFRFCSDDKILAANTDKYLPISPTEDIDDFDWDVQGNNLFDKFSSEFNKTYSDDIAIESAEINEFGDLKICFSHSITLTAFVDTTSSEECWRIFEYRGDKKHLVMTGKGISAE